ncbi:MAG TPA: Bax inhibitor-1/YccA family protein [Propionibacterium sp.]|nr:Bax inhibitor-1/YccA family protein [Propionibacterium sp.]
MQSTNPIFTRSEQFTRAAPQYGQQQYGQQGQPHGAPQYGAPAPYQAPTQPSTRGVMTIDDVITKTAITIGALIVTAALTFMFLPPQFMLPALIGSGIVGFVTVLLVAFRRTINPGAVLIYAAIEGVFIGAFSLLFELMYPGIVVQAVIGTFIAAGATLAAYKFLRIKVTNKFRKIVTIATFALAGTLLVNFVLAMFGTNLGLRSFEFTPLAGLISAIAVVLAVANLIMDFDFVEQGIRNRLPASESWRAAFGLTVTMVWLYTEILRILSYFRSN